MRVISPLSININQVSHILQVTCILQISCILKCKYLDYFYFIAFCLFNI